MPLLSTCSGDNRTKKKKTFDLYDFEIQFFRTIEEVKQVFKSGQDPTNFQWGNIGKQLF